jgi:hypothetical protein
MIEIFHGDNKAKHDAFQAWRRRHPDGFHMTEKDGGIFSTHWTQDKRENAYGRGCNHQGVSDIPYQYDKASCYTKAKKVCSDSLQELQNWAIEHGVTVKSCAHCDNKRFPFPKVEKGAIPPPDTGSGIPKGNKSPSATATSVIQYERDLAVRAWVLKQAAGECECCLGSAPFRGMDGQPFLEVHHVRGLADGGTDTVSNTVALCPNCHRRLHHGVDASQAVERLYKQIGRLLKE